jgi:hypothetical protein|tara:strand:- start:1706 stop:1894 length:189 start_codon:yes stop_codon:yes gene_type:complete
MSDDVLSLLKKKLRGQMNEIADMVSVGSAKNMEEYRKMCGIIEGLAWAEREIIDIEDKLNEF